MEVTSIKQLFILMKNRFYGFLADTVVNIHTLEGVVLSALVYIFPTHAKEITEFFAIYLGFKSNK